MKLEDLKAWPSKTACRSWVRLFLVVCAIYLPGVSYAQNEWQRIVQNPNFPNGIAVKWNSMGWKNADIRLHGGLFEFSTELGPTGRAREIKLGHTFIEVDSAANWGGYRDKGCLLPHIGENTKLMYLPRIVVEPPYRRMGVHRSALGLIINDALAH